MPAQLVDAAPGPRARPGRSRRRRRVPPRRTAPATVCGRSSRSTLLTAITTGTSAPRSVPAIQRSPGPMPCSPLTTNSAASDSDSSASTRRCMRSVSASRGRWTPGQVDEHDLRVGRASATPRIARRVVCGLSETIATLPPTMRVDERRLADVRAAGERDEPRARRHQRSSSACSASISPSSVSWSMPVRCSAPWTIASRRSSCARGRSRCRRARAGRTTARPRRPGRRARPSALAGRGTRRLSAAIRSAPTYSIATWPSSTPADASAIPTTRSTSACDGAVGPPSPMTSTSSTSLRASAVGLRSGSAGRSSGVPRSACSS